MALPGRLMIVGFAAGFSSGMLGIGGGTVLVPMLVYVAAFTQHRAHATSLAAGIFLGAVGGLTYALAGEVELVVGGLLAAGALVGAPIGARIMHRVPSDRLKVAFGVLLVALAVVMVLG